MYPHNGQLVWPGLVWPGLLRGSLWPSVGANTILASVASLFIGMKIYQKCIMHLYLLYVNTKIMCLTFDPAQTTMWPHVATSLGLIMKLSSAPARLWLWLWLRLELELCRCQADSLPLSLAGSQSAWEEGQLGKEGGLLSWAPFGVPRILHSNTNQTGPPIDTRYSPLKRSFIMLLKFNK